MGAYILLHPHARVVTLIPIFFVFTTFNIPAIVYLGFWFVSQLFSGLASLGATMGGVAWWAHIGGFLFGLIISRFFMWRPKPLPEPWSPYKVIDIRNDDRGW
jgi:membrane associated rhomboid family serine protease